MKAFPSPEVVESNGVQYQTTSASSGMDLRDYFAAKALNSAYTFWMRDYYALNLDDCETERGFMANYNLIAESAYELADAMLEARESTK